MSQQSVLTSIWEPVVDDSARPSMDYGLVAGGTFGKLGVVAAFTFSNKLQSIFDQDRIFYIAPSEPGGPPLERNIFKYDESTMPALRASGHLTRDSRMVERKKYGQRGARRRYQYSKR